MNKRSLPADIKGEICDPKTRLGLSPIVDALVYANWSWNRASWWRIKAREQKHFDDLAEAYKESVLENRGRYDPVITALERKAEELAESIGIPCFRTHWKCE
ncbi:hypothetical protein ACHAWF_017493 [Thalassiosira exigua]